MTKFEKFVIIVLMIMVVLLSIMIATGEIRIVIVVGEKLVDKARTIDAKKIAKFVDIIAR